MSMAQRVAARRRLEEMREDACEVRDEALPGSGLYEALRRVIREIDSALDGLRF